MPGCVPDRDPLTGLPVPLQLVVRCRRGVEVTSETLDEQESQPPDIALA